MSAGVSPYRPTAIGDLVWRPSLATLRRLALANIVVNVGIAVTGVGVRVTNSGLGCPNWPDCTGDSLVPRHNPQHPPLNMAIEFGNRLLTYLVFAVAAACVVAAWRLRHGPDRADRPDLLKLAWVVPVGVAAQAVWGGLVVLTKLNPAMVAGHLLLSAGLVAATVALYVRCTEDDAPTRPVVRTELYWLGRALVVVVLALLAAGTVVTNTGPHAGDSDASPRFHFNIQQVAQVHADIVWITVGLSFALLLALRLTEAPRQATRWAATLLGVELAQGAIGYAQYFLAVPAGLVIAHVLGAMLVWIATLRTVFALRVRHAESAVDAATVASTAETKVSG